MFVWQFNLEKAHVTKDIEITEEKHTAVTGDGLTFWLSQGNVLNLLSVSSVA